jgi:hypothetical protein
MHQISVFEKPLSDIKLFECEMTQEEKVSIPGRNEDESTKDMEVPREKCQPWSDGDFMPSKHESRGQWSRCRGDRGQQRDSFTGKCHYSHKPGHSAQDCGSKQRHSQVVNRERPVRRNGTVGLRSTPFLQKSQVQLKQ